MVEPEQRRGNAAGAKEDPLNELERIVSGKYERRRHVEPAVDTSALDFEAELIRQMDSPLLKSPRIMEARAAAPLAAEKAQPVAHATVAAGQPKRSLATPVARAVPGQSGAKGAAANLLPAHSAPSLDSSLEDQLLDELGLDAELFGNAVKRRRPEPTDPKSDRQFAEALESELQDTEPAAGDEDLDALAEEFSSNDGDREEPQREDITDTVAARSAPQAFSEIDLDFGTAFKTAFEKIESDRSARILKEEQEAARQSVSLANASENTLEAHFASAFADELALGVASLHAPKAGTAKSEQEPTMRKAHATAQPIRHVDPGQMNAADLRSQPGQVPDAEDFDLADSEFDTALQEEMLTSEQEYGAPVRPERKLFKYALFGFAIAVAAGLGVTGYLYYFNSQKAGAPALIRADVDPVKIKPQNQGGTEIANSDKASYERLSGKFSPDAKQEKLVDSAEDPIAIEGSGDDAAAGTAVEQAAVVDATIGDEDSQADALNGKADQSAAPVNDPAKIVAGSEAKVDAKVDAKSGERLPALEQKSVARSINGALSIQPRRVKTLTVRADGTLVQSDQAKAEAGAQADGAQAGPLANQAAAEGSAAAKVADQLAAKTNSVEPVKVATVRVRTNQAGGQAGAEGAAKIDAAQAGQSAGAANEVKTASLQDDGASLARGEWAVQVSSQRTPEEAQAAYKNLRNKFPDLLEGRQMAVQRADLGDKGTFYRVRITAPNKEDAGKFCDSLKAAGGSCFVTR